MKIWFSNRIWAIFYISWSAYLKFFLFFLFFKKNRIPITSFNNKPYFFFPDSNFRVLTFFRLFFEKILFWIFFLKLSLETSDLARICNFWCFSRKNDLTWKKKSFWHFFWKINFSSIFVKLKIFSDQGTPKFFIHHFPISQVLNYSFMQKKLLKIIFGALRELYLTRITFSKTLS